MSSAPDSALHGYAKAIALRTGYLILTGRLSSVSEGEMSVLAGQLEILDEVMSRALATVGSGSATRAIMQAACLREIRRRRQLVIDDAQQACARARELRGRAVSARHIAARNRLRVIADPQRLELSSLERVVQRWGVARLSRAG